MNKEKIKSIFALVLGISVASTVAFFTFYCSYKERNDREYKWNVETYSEDSNYTNCTAKIVEQTNNAAYKISDLTYVDGKPFPSNCPHIMRVCSFKESEVDDLLIKEVGKTICFTACFGGWFYPYYCFPVVQISIDNVEILSFEDGKKALLNYIERFK